MVIHRRFLGHDTPALMVIFRIFQRFFQESYGILSFPSLRARLPQLNMAKYGPLQEFPLRLHGVENTVFEFRRFFGIPASLYTRTKLLMVQILSL